MPRLLALAAFAASSVLAQSGLVPLDPWAPATQAVLLDDPAPQRPEGATRLLQWRQAYALRTETDSTAEVIAQREILERPELATGTTLEALERVLAARRPFLDALRADAATVVEFPRTQGPETPIEDAAPLRRAAGDRMLAVRVALARGDAAAAVDHAVALVHFARVLLDGQESILGCIAALGVASVALEAAEDVFDLAPPETTAPLRHALDEGWDGRLARAYVRALRGEFHFVFRRVVTRMPETSSPQDLLDAVATMGIPGALDEPRGAFDALGPIVNPLLDRLETERLYAAVVAPYLVAVGSGTLPPRGAYTLHRRVVVDGFTKEFGPLTELFFGEPDAPRIREQANVWRARLEAVENPMGKLLVQLNLPEAESLAESLMRREAARRILLAREILRRARVDGAWPADLAAVPPRLRIDPYTGTTLRYDPTRNRIWSAGPNRTDDLGVIDAENPVLSPDLAWTLEPRTR